MSAVKISAFDKDGLHRTAAANGSIGDDNAADTAATAAVKARGNWGQRVDTGSWWRKNVVISCPVAFTAAVGLFAFGSNCPRLGNEVKMTFNEDALMAQVCIIINN
jgi:hypothetical protein